MATRLPVIQISLLSLSLIVVQWVQDPVKTSDKRLGWQSKLRRLLSYAAAEVIGDGNGNFIYATRRCRVANFYVLSPDYH